MFTVHPCMYCYKKISDLAEFYKEIKKLVLITILTSQGLWWSSCLLEQKYGLSFNKTCFLLRSSKFCVVTGIIPYSVLPLRSHVQTADLMDNKVFRGQGNLCTLVRKQIMSHNHLSNERNLPGSKNSSIGRSSNTTSMLKYCSICVIHIY